MVELRVFNVLGQEVASLVNDRQTAGIHTVKWQAGNSASGAYVYRLKVTSNGVPVRTHSRMMMITK
jgi:hypothetical protein